MTTSPPEPTSARPAGGTAAPPPRGGWRWRLATTWDLLRGGTQTPLKTSLALGLGVAVALAVPPPFQTPAALGLALLLRLNSLVTFAGTLVWQPFTAPFLLLLQHRVGSAILPAPRQRTGVWEPYIKPVLAGIPVTALAGGAAAAALCYLALLVARKMRGRARGAEGAP